MARFYLPAGQRKRTGTSVSVDALNGKEPTRQQQLMGRLPFLQPLRRESIMLAITDFTTSRLLTWRGITIQLFPLRTRYYVYLLCYAKTPYKHAKHYLGSSCCIDSRLQQHRSGSGARLMQVIHQAGITFELVRLWPCASAEEARQLERKLKKQHSPVLCPECNPRRQKDALVLLRQGHYPFHLFDKPGRRQPLQKGGSPCLQFN